MNYIQLTWALKKKNTKNKVLILKHNTEIKTFFKFPISKSHVTWINFLNTASTAFSWSSNENESEMSPRKKKRWKKMQWLVFLLLVHDSYLYGIYFPFWSANSEMAISKSIKAGFC